MVIKKGFTLIELMVVVGIITLISSLIVVSVNQSRIKSHDAKRIADMGTVSSALASYYADNHYFPNATYGTLGTVLAGYLSTLPTDPINTGSNVYSYQKCPTSCTNSGTSFCNSYYLHAYLQASANNPISNVNDYYVNTGEAATSAPSCPAS